jgi:pimeloyl-ACP methyl ester carboxylesterase
MATAPEPNPRLDLFYAAPQRLVKIGRRRRLNLLIAGEGEPAVIFAPGGGASTLEWGPVQHRIAKKTRTVAYDNAGFGFSDPGPLPRTASAIVNDLRAALRAADVPPPYVLVGWSMGGLIMRLFAFLYPQEVIGMVMVDTSTEYMARRYETAGDPAFAKGRRKQNVRWRRAMTRAERLARDGALLPGTPEYDEFVGAPLPTLTPAVNAARKSQLTSPRYYRALRSELAHLASASSDEVAAARRPLGDIPLIVLTAGRSPVPTVLSERQAEAYRQVKLAMHVEIAALSTRGERRTIDAGHAILLEKPEVVVAAVEEVLALASSVSRRAKRIP